MKRLLLVLLSVGSLTSAAVAQGAGVRSGRTRVVMLGTGNPVADPDRFGPAMVVVVDSTAYLVDCGVGVVRRWAAAIRNGIGPFQPWDLRRVFITHLHSDHTLGYPDLILSSWTLERSQREPLHVFGPTGTRAMTDALLRAYAEDIRVRTGPGGELAGSAAPKVDVHEITAGEVYHDALVRVTAFKVHHGTFPEAFGFRFQTPDRDIVISGDAAPPSSIPDQCHGCDILIHEGGFFHRDSGSEYQRQFHTSMEDLVEVARLARPKLLVMTHQPGNNESGLQFVREYYDGRVVVAHDLDVF